ncbi:MAG: hypothetical protein JJE48_10745, partial [Actinobacteria bacterium]|nr:hypothetical protein [Actinomycetota bacterium]
MVSFKELPEEELFLAGSTACLDLHHHETQRNLVAGYGTLALFELYPAAQGRCLQ